MKPLNLVVFGFNPWSRMWKRTQTLTSLLRGRPGLGDILFVNPSLHAMDLARRPVLLKSSAVRESLAYAGGKRTPEGVTVYTPVVPPLAYPGKPLAGLRRRLEMGRIGPFVRDDFILYMNALLRKDNTVFWELFERARHRIFDWSDDFSTFAANARERRVDEEIATTFLEASDLVVAVNESLAARARQVNPHSYCLRNATNFELMNRAESEATPVHGGIAALRGPVVGYMGYMNPTRIDTELLRAVATENPDLQFVFLGPMVTDNPLGTELPLRPNVHFFPPVPYDELPGVLKGFDVCIIPNRINEHTAGNDPIKLFDYLACGRPIVATPTAGLEGFAEVVDLATDATEFTAALRRNLQPRAGADEARARRLQAARENSWQARADKLGGWLDAAILNKGAGGE
ncbi:hypothetical protein CSB20_03210 [bacterium DOLZORAL124_64_63]|nr:MAG: hypothetical protein CSB20_03210 [bacterium DOLZORAL124_64_63]